MKNGRNQFRILAILVAIVFGAALFYLFIQAFDLYITQRCLEMPAGQMMTNEDCKELFR